MARTRRNRISPIDLSAAVDDILTEYGEEADRILKRSIEEVTVDAVQKLQAVNTFAPWGHPSGVYSWSWTYADRIVGRFKTVSTIYNSDHYQLAHLLEHGHANRGGGRTPAYPHIKPISDWTEEEVVREFERRIKE